MKRMHVVGCPRSGTTLMLQLLATCFNIDGYCEFEMNIYKEPEENYNLFLSKKPGDIRIIKPILDADPNLYIVYMIRDPRAVVCSMHYSSKENYFCNFNIWKQYDIAAKPLFQHPRFISVRYEDLVINPDKEQQQIAEKFTFLEETHKFSEYQNYSKPSENASKAMKGLRPVSADSLHSWKKHLPRIKAELQTHPEMQEKLVEYGYENNADWQKILENVEAKFTKSEKGNQRAFLKVWEWKFRNWLKYRRKIKHIAKKNAQ